MATRAIAVLFFVRLIFIPRSYRMAECKKIQSKKTRWALCRLAAFW